MFSLPTLSFSLSWAASGAAQKAAQGVALLRKALVIDPHLFDVYYDLGVGQAELLLCTLREWLRAAFLEEKLRRQGFLRSTLTVKTL